MSQTTLPTHPSALSQEAVSTCAYSHTTESSPKSDEDRQRLLRLRPKHFLEEQARDRHALLRDLLLRRGPVQPYVSSQFLPPHLRPREG